MIYILLGMSLFLNLATLAIVIAIGVKQVKFDEKFAKITSMLESFFGDVNELLEATEEEKEPTWEQNLLAEEAARRRQMTSNLIDPKPPRDNWGAPPAPANIPDLKIANIPDKK